MKRLLDEHRAKTQPITAAKYRGILGVPAVFSRTLFEQLSNLSGDAGARLVIKRSGDKVAAVDMPEAAVDWDCPEDMSALGST